MSKLSVTPKGADEPEIEIELAELSRQLGDQYIISDDAHSPDFAYLAAIALETHDDPKHDIENTLMEFIRNASSLDVSAEGCDAIESLLRDY